MSEGEGPRELPPGWAWATLGEVGHFVRGITFAKGDVSKTLDRARIVCLRTKNVQEQLDLSDLIYVPRDAVRSDAQLLRRGDLLFSLSNSLALVGKACRVSTSVEPAPAFGAFLAAFRCRPEIDERVVLYFTRSARYQSWCKENASTTTNISNLGSAKLAAMPIPMAPAKEQARIADQLDELFGEIEAGEQELEKAREGLATYRRAVLKAAVTGELTREWRQNRHFDENSTPFLHDILAARRDFLNANTQPLQSDRKGRGKASAKRYAEPIPPEHAGLPRLPGSWAWASMDQLLTSIEAGLNYRCEERPPRADEVGIVKVSAVTWGSFDETASKTITDDDRADETIQIRAGDFLFSRANTLELVGAPVVVESVSRNLLLSDKVLRFRFAAPLERWVCYVLRSPWGRGEIESRATGNQLSMRNITQESIRKLRVPLPPMDELNEAIARLDGLMAECSTMDDALNAWGRDARRTRQSILRAAFSGRLVSQEPTDEPASTLLERIRSAANVEIPKGPEPTAPFVARRRGRSALAHRSAS